MHSLWYHDSIPPPPMLKINVFAIYNLNSTIDISVALLEDLGKPQDVYKTCTEKKTEGKNISLLIPREKPT